MAGTRTQDDIATLAAIGMIAACLSAFGHEAFGHGGACRAVGGTIELLTATHFACQGGNLAVDIAGPAMNLVLAAIGFGGRALRPGRATRWFLLFLGAVNLCWFAGELVAAPVVDHYDEAAIARQLGWPPIWRPLVFALGLATYAATIRLAAARLRDGVRAGDDPKALRRRLGITHGAATLAFAIAGLCWARAPIAAAFECLMTLGVAVAPVWIAVGAAARTRGESPGMPIGRSWGWVLAAIALFAFFLLLQARGFGPLA